MSYIYFDGLFEKQGTDSSLWKVVKNINQFSCIYEPHDTDISTIPVKNGDIVIGFSLGGRTALHLIESYPEIQFKEAIFIEPVFGFCWFGCKKIVPKNVTRFLQTKCANTLPWAIWQYVVREDKKLSSSDKFVKVPGGHADAPMNSLQAITEFLKS